MKNLDFRYICAHNFLCFGPKGIEFNFKKYSNIVLIRGNNLDVKELDDEKTASNGVGKSSIPEIIVYSLFGKTIKHPKKITHKDVINNQSQKGLKTEVQWGDFRVVRTRKPDSLRVWEDPEHEWREDTEITLGGIPATQKLIEDKIGLNYETFVNLFVFTDNNSGSFLECDASDKRQIVENLLSLDKYVKFAESAKVLKKDKKDSIKSIIFEIETFNNNLKLSESRKKSSEQQKSQWENQKKIEIKEIKNKIELLKNESEPTESGIELSNYLESQKEIEVLNNEMPKIEKKQSELENVISVAKEKLENNSRLKNSNIISIDNINNSLSNFGKLIIEYQKEIDKLEKNKGSKCKFCFGKVSEDNYKNYVEGINNKIVEIKSDQEEKEKEKDEVNIKIKSLDEIISKLQEGIKGAKSNLETASSNISKKRKKILELSKIEKPQGKDLNAKLAEQKINNLNDLLVNKQKELKSDNPFDNIIESINKEIEDSKELLNTKKEDLDKLENELPYYDFWVTAFGDSGIRKFIIDGIIPALNSRIAYWLQFLIDGKIKLEFNNELEEIIQRNPSDGDPFVYHAMSGGERRRLNLAVSQAFAHVMMLNSGICPSLVFLDEVTTNIDPIGVLGVYNMIIELAKNRQVFITTHDQNLLDLLEGCELINLEKQGGFTSLKKI